MSSTSQSWLPFWAQITYIYNHHQQPAIWVPFSFETFPHTNLHCAPLEVVVHPHLASHQAGVASRRCSIRWTWKKQRNLTQQNGVTKTVDPTSNNCQRIPLTTTFTGQMLWKDQVVPLHLFSCKHLRRVPVQKAIGIQQKPPYFHPSSLARQQLLFGAISMNFASPKTNPPLTKKQLLTIQTIRVPGIACAHRTTKPLGQNL